MSSAMERNMRKERVGVVTSDKMQKSVTVLVERRVKHAKYGKFVKLSSKFMAHDEKEEAHVGDTVRIMETRPLSKSKRWRVVEIVERAK
jgi:small subunit ribosomal protein S17